MRLTVRADIEDRNFHGETHRNGGAEFHFTQNCRPLPDRPGFAFTPAPDRQLRVFSNAGVYHPQPEWCQDIPHPVEQSRGQVPSGDAYSPGWFDLPLTLGKSVTVALSADIPPPAFGVVGAKSPPAARPPTHWPCAAPDSRRTTPSDGNWRWRRARFVARRGAGRTIIAGYPWFLDWGRDSFISARGLLAAGMVSEVADLLVTFGRFSASGLMPNTIHGEDASNRDTSDAPLVVRRGLRGGGARWTKISMTHRRARRAGPSPASSAKPATLTRAARPTAFAWTRPPP